MTPQDIAADYIALWNERDEKSRAERLERAWTLDATYADPLASVAGRAQIDGLIGAVQARFPAFRFAPLGSPDGHGDYARFRWGLGPEGQEPVVKGFDVIRMKEGRVAEVIGFLDQVPL